MARTAKTQCRICLHKNRGDIDAALATGAMTQDALVREYKLSLGGIRRHKQLHLSVSVGDALAIIGDAPKPGQYRTLADELYAYKVRADRIGVMAETKGDLRSALLAIRELRGLIETHQRILSTQRVGPVDIASSVEWQELSRRLLAALEPHPAAYDAVLAVVAAMPAPERGPRAPTGGVHVPRDEEGVGRIHSPEPLLF